MKLILYGLEATKNAGVEEVIVQSPARVLAEMAGEGVAGGLFGYRDDKDLELAANAADLYRDLSILLVVSQDHYSPALYRRAIASGVEVVTPSELTARLSGMNTGVKKAERVEGSEIVRTLEDIASRERHTLKRLVAAAYSRDGGVGKSTFVATAGVYMAKASENFSSVYKVVVVDLDLEKEQGSLAEMLCVPARTTVL